ncbi:MAG: hypothetical protein ACK4K9_11235 [Bacteroidia bacterium]
MHKLFGWLFLLTGVFAILGGLYTWGDGSIFLQNELIMVLIPWADIILTGPVSVITGYALLKHINWANKAGLFTSGIYLFGSVQVFITMIWNYHFSIILFIPALSGLLIALMFLRWQFYN